MARQITDTASGTITVEGVDDEPKIAPFQITNVDIPSTLAPGDKEQVVIDLETDDPGRTHFINGYIGDEQIIDQEYNGFNDTDTTRSFVFTMPTVESSEVEWTVEVGVEV